MLQWFKSTMITTLVYSSHLLPLSHSCSLQAPPASLNLPSSFLLTPITNPTAPSPSSSLAPCPFPPTYRLNVTQEDLTPETTKALVAGLKAGKPPKAGPQSGRHSSEAAEGRTALTSQVSTVIRERIVFFSLLRVENERKGNRAWASEG